MTLPIMLMIPRCSCLRRAAKMRLFGGAGEGSRGCFRAQPGEDGAAARTASALRGDQRPCIGIANVLLTTKRKKKEKKKRGKKGRRKKLLRGNVERVQYVEGLWLHGCGMRTCFGGGQRPPGPGAHGTSVPRLQEGTKETRPLPRKKK